MAKWSERNDLVQAKRRGDLAGKRRHLLLRLRASGLRWAGAQFGRAGGDEA